MAKGKRVKGPGREARGEGPGTKEQKDRGTKAQRHKGINISGAEAGAKAHANIRIGNQSAYSALTMMLPFEYALDNGFDAFEWFPDKKESGEGWDEGDMDAAARAYIRETARKHDIALSVHTSLQADPRVPEARRLAFQDIRFARDIGAVLLNIHLLNNDGIRSYIKAIEPLIRRTAEAGIRLAIENTVFTGPDAFNELFAILQKRRGLPVSHVGMCLDIGHANLVDASRNDYLKFIDLLAPHVPVIHIHMHENYGDGDSHLPVFTGPSGSDDSGIRGIAERMKKRGYSGCVILEQWPMPPVLLNEARDRLSHLFHSAQ